jgi:hypothetical protein
VTADVAVGPWRVVVDAHSFRIDSRVVGPVMGRTEVQVRAWVEGAARELATGATLEQALANLSCELVRRAMTVAAPWEPLEGGVGVQGEVER